MASPLSFRSWSVQVTVSTLALTLMLMGQHSHAFQSGQDFWQVSATGVTASLRGLEICDDGQTLWACGANSTIIRSVDVGRTWKTVSPKGFDKLEFRSIHAFDANQAIIASAGTPAVVLRTEDGGQTWKEVLRRTEEKAFFDALKFFDTQRGLVFSDPVNEKWLILTTTNGGSTWEEVAATSIPKLRAGEAAFAASNSALCIDASGKAWIGTGGFKSDQSRIYLSNDFGKSWQESYAPIPSGEASGIFSLAYVPSGRLVAVGGDYRGDAKSLHTAAYSDDDGKTWTLAKVEPIAFRSSAVVLINPRNQTKTWVTTGPGGTDTSFDGSVWKMVSDVGFHALDSHPNGTLVAVGSEGRFGIKRLR